MLLVEASENLNTLCPFLRHPFVAWPFKQAARVNFLCMGALLMFSKW
ncbi:hypothetical protein ATL17_2492 [Maritalea mobilis]|uniref:Uncharacterized protein n=1 Tax=Maritalea mobilis TaxID=483324 RepID=A0A4R6VQC6_9HYPH|nr:hypothetical protein ATL17_2492 [Maritalea mobilis]